MSVLVAGTNRMSPASVRPEYCCHTSSFGACTGWPADALHSCAPVFSSKAETVPEDEPTKTAPLATIGADVRSAADPSTPVQPQRASRARRMRGECGGDTGFVAKVSWSVPRALRLGTRDQGVHNTSSCCVMLNVLADGQPPSTVGSR